jgi:hypothetical protein
VVSATRLATKTVEGTALALQSIDDVERGNSLAFGVLSVGDCISDDTLKEGLQDASSLLIDHSGDTFDTTTTSETTDGRLCYTLDVVSKNLAMTFGSALAKALSTFAACN